MYRKLKKLVNRSIFQLKSLRLRLGLNEANRYCLLGTGENRDAFGLENKKKTGLKNR